MTNKIDREDMLALTRRMNVARSSFTRIGDVMWIRTGTLTAALT